MKKIAILALLGLGALGIVQAQTPTVAAQPLIVHEWGTFTSVAGKDGKAVQWLPLNGPADLPRFVDRLRLNLKTSLCGRIRMETPVLYFYAPRDVTVNVSVRFRQGAVTEWFPHAVVTPETVTGPSLGRPGFSSSITWRDVKVSPGGSEDFPVDASSSHYYAARATDASPLQSGSEKEKFLFYRGVGDFEPPIQATALADGHVVVRNPGGKPVGDVILFENAGGMMDYQVRHETSDQVTFDPPAGDGELAPPTAALERILLAHGLYVKEARAMINTWRDLWFGEGTRLFYVVSRKTIDDVLPLKITPTPTEITRVLIGRVELVTSRTEERFLLRSGRFLTCGSRDSAR